MIVYKLMDKNIIGDKYKSFLDLCFYYSTHFTLTFHEINIQHEIEEKLQFYCVKKFQTYNWYCYTTFEKSLNISVYLVNNDTKNILLNYYDNIYCEPSFNIEDICFFNKKELLFGSVSHEEIANLFLNSYEELSLFKKLALWQQEKFVEKDYVQLFL